MFFILFFLSFSFGLAVCGLCWCLVLLLVGDVFYSVPILSLLNENSVSVKKKIKKKITVWDSNYT